MSRKPPIPRLLPLLASRYDLGRDAAVTPGNLARALASAPTRSGDRRPLRPPRGWRKGWLLLLWAGVSLMSIGPTYLHYLAEGQAVPWSRLWSEAAGWYIWILLFPLILWGSRRFPLESRRWRANILAHLGIGGVIAVLYAVLVLCKNQLFLFLGTGQAAPGVAAMLPGFLLGGFQIYFLIYWMIVAAVHAVDYYRKYRERELRALELEARLSKAQLQVLKMQLDPHFLFNTLNAISVLVFSDPEAAEKMIASLSDFLRLSLQSSTQQEVPLAEEIDFLEQYLEIEKTRFGERLSVHLDLDPTATDALLPSLILQPLVENAIRYSTEASSGPVEIRVHARVAAGRWLEIQVADNGPGLDAPLSEVLQKGVGLSNTIARLEQLYGSSQRLELRNAESGGTVASLVIPWQPASGVDGAGAGGDGA